MPGVGRIRTGEAVPLGLEISLAGVLKHPSVGYFLFSLQVPSMQSPEERG